MAFLSRSYQLDSINFDISNVLMLITVITRTMIKFAKIKVSQEPHDLECPFNTSSPRCPYEASNFMSYSMQLAAVSVAVECPKRNYKKRTRDQSFIHSFIPLPFLPYKTCTQTGSSPLDTNPVPTDIHTAKV